MPDFFQAPGKLPRTIPIPHGISNGNYPTKHKLFCWVIYYTFTALLRKRLILNGAGGGNRTLVSSLENCRSTIELHPPR